MAERIPVFFKFERTVAHAVCELAHFFEETDGAIHVSDLPQSATYRIIDPPEEVLAIVLPPKVEAEEIEAAAEEAAAPEAAEAPAAAAEPASAEEST